MKDFIKKLFCTHPPLKCEEYSSTNFEPDTRITYNSPWVLFGTRETRYKCLKCKKLFWYTKGDIDYMKMTDKFWDELLGKD
jgi:hypothetical protein